MAPTAAGATVPGGASEPALAGIASKLLGLPPAIRDSEVAVKVKEQLANMEKLLQALGEQAAVAAAAAARPAVNAPMDIDLPAGSAGAEIVTPVLAAGAERECRHTAPELAVGTAAGKRGPNPADGSSASAEEPFSEELLAELDDVPPGQPIPEDLRGKLKAARGKVRHHPYGSQGAGAA